MDYLASAPGGLPTTLVQVGDSGEFAQVGLEMARVDTPSAASLQVGAMLGAVSSSRLKSPMLPNAKEGGDVGVGIDGPRLYFDEFGLPHVPYLDVVLKVALPTPTPLPASWVRCV